MAPCQLPRSSSLGAIPEFHIPAGWPTLSNRVPPLNAQGEITLVLEGATAAGGPPPDKAQLAAVLRRLLQGGESASSAAKLAAAECGVPKKAVYGLAVQLSGEELPQD